MPSRPPTRTCGLCQACCEFPAVVSLSKPAFSPCAHQCQRGCSTYPTRPQPCRDYSCLWLEGEFALDQRPDTLGLAFDRPESWVNHPDYEGVPFLCAREVRPGAARELAVVELLRRLSGSFVVRLSLWGGGVQLIGPASLIRLLQRRASDRS